MGIRDGLLQHALAGDDGSPCDQLASEAYDKSLEIEQGHSYYGLWHLLTRVKWLYRTGDAAGGLALALEAIPRIERMADRNLLERMKLLAADGLGRTGRAVEGAGLMAHAVLDNPDPPLEILAEAARVAGRLAAHDNPAAAAGHFDRAARILQSVGHVTARNEILRDARDTAAAYTAHDLRPPAATLAERLASLLDCAAHPPLLADETLALLADTGATLCATGAETHPDGTRHYFSTTPGPDAAAAIHARPDAVRVDVGRHRGRVYEVVAIPRPSPTARATVLAVERLAHTSLALAHARHQERERAALWPEHTPERELGLVCASERMLDLIKTVRRIAPSAVTVLITGETGVGKELFARALHRASPRHERVFLPFNCSTVPKDLIDSQLFGYRRGAFTGAQADAPGLIRSASGGTLFLDEIGEMSLEAQPKLLRFLETGEVLPVGDTRPVTVDVRVVAATNANLDALVADGRFREDLYYRLNVIPLRVPPLRERREEIPLLVEHFLERTAAELQKPMPRIADDTLEYLVLHAWPGNVRQLANEVRRVVALTEPGAVIMPEHLSADIAASRRTVPAGERRLDPTELVVRTDQPLAAATEHLERAMIQRALASSDGQIDVAARMLGLSRKGLYLKRHRFGLG